MLCRVTILNMMVVEELGNGDLPTGYNKRAAFDLHSYVEFMLLTWKIKEMRCQSLVNYVQFRAQWTTQNHAEASAYR